VLQFRTPAFPASLVFIPSSASIAVWKGLKLKPQLGCGTDRVAKHMAGLVADLTPVAAGEGAAEGDPRPVYTWTGPSGSEMNMVRSYPPFDGGAPRLVVHMDDGACLGVWETGTGAFLGALQGPDDSLVCSLVTYQRPSDPRFRVAAGSEGGYFCIWQGDDFRVLHVIQTNQSGFAVRWLAVYEEPTSGRTRLVTG
jgi:hypothetical protein